MAQRRFGPVVVAVVLASCVLVARLFQVQILEHEVWADEAASLVRNGRQVPYRRGDIVDRSGRVLAHDVESYRVEFEYRDFRRDHPLGQVAHALGAIECRAVPLREAWARMEELALALVSLTPREVESFGRGGALAAGPLTCGAIEGGRLDREQRGARRNDLSFYVTRVLGLEWREQDRLLRAVRKEHPEESYLELAAIVRGGKSAEDVARLRDDVLRRVAECRADLIHLGRLVADEEEFRGDDDAVAQRLIEHLEAWRTEVEDGAASGLFRMACGFEAGRVAPPTLLGHVDFQWLELRLCWDSARTRQWLERAHDAWRVELGLQQGDAGGSLLPRLLIEAELAPVERDRSELVLQAWQRPFLALEGHDEKSAFRRWVLGEPPHLAHPLVVFRELDDLFNVPVPRRARPSDTQLFAFQLPEWVDSDGPDPALRMARMELLRPTASQAELEALAPQIERRAGEWREWLKAYEQEGLAGRDLERWTREVWGRWEEEFQGALASELEFLDAAAEGPLELADGRLDNAGERARFALRDYGSRRIVVVEAPTYELAHLLERRQASYAGFRVEAAHERVIEPDPDFASEAARARAPARRPLVPDLIGRVRTPQLRDLFAKSEERRAFELLRRMGRRDAVQQERFQELAAAVWRSDEKYGSDGIEGYFNSELSGHNGYVEERGMQEDLEREESATDVPPIDGQEVALTLDSDLQLAALDCFADPRPGPDEAKNDPDWLAHPTGALVLLSVEGDVLAMASWPDAARQGARTRADMPLERTLRLFDSQPPGSVMKPFTAAYALEHRHLDPAESLECSSSTHEDGRAGYRTVHCSLRDGHGHVDLREALRRSCNSYFAWLGDTHYDPVSYLDMYRTFGFGTPTGVRQFNARAGLREDGWRPETQPQASALEETRTRMLACNGLGMPQTTVMQVARAYAGLATGWLPEVRLARSIGGQPVERARSKIEISRSNLDTVREALVACANETAWPAGSAAAALNQGALGFRAAAKTGSADLRKSDVEGESRVLKHTWLASYFPADEPKFVLIVFCYQTRATAGHSSIWIAQQFLQHPAMQGFLAKEGVMP